MSLDLGGHLAPGGLWSCVWLVWGEDGGSGALEEVGHVLNGSPNVLSPGTRCRLGGGTEVDRLGFWKSPCCRAFLCQLKSRRWRLLLRYFPTAQALATCPWPAGTAQATTGAAAACLAGTLEPGPTENSSISVCPGAWEVPWLSPSDLPPSLLSPLLA